MHNSLTCPTRSQFMACLKSLVDLRRATAALITSMLWAAPLLADTAKPERCSTPIETGHGTAYQVEVDGHPIALWSKSPAQPKATLLLIHGRTWSGKPDFDLATACEDLSLMNGLFEQGIETFAADMRGYGQTPRDESGWLTPNRAAQDIAGVLRWLQTRALKRGDAQPIPHLFGWSYGATMAQLTLQQHPELAQSLTLFGYAVRKGYHRLPANQPQEPARAANSYTNAISDFIVPDAISDGAIQAFAKSALDADPVRVDWTAQDQWRVLDGKKVQQPTLLLQGEFDPLTRKRVHRKLFRRLPNPQKQWIVLEGGDHAAFMETPRKKFIEQLSEFVLTTNKE